MRWKQRWPRQRNETLAGWLDRLEATDRDRIAAPLPPHGHPLPVGTDGERDGERGRLPELRRLLALHYRLRFDPRGLESPDRELLRTGVAAWLDTH